jgi:hypothetical protein
MNNTVRISSLSVTNFQNLSNTSVWIFQDSLGSEFRRHQWGNKQDRDKGNLTNPSCCGMHCKPRERLWRLLNPQRTSAKLCVSHKRQPSFLHRTVGPKAPKFVHLVPGSHRSTRTTACPADYYPLASLSGGNGRSESLFTTDHLSSNLLKWFYDIFNGVDTGAVPLWFFCWRDTDRSGSWLSGNTVDTKIYVVRAARA